MIHPKSREEIRDYIRNELKIHTNQQYENDCDLGEECRRPHADHIENLVQESLSSFLAYVIEQSEPRNFTCSYGGDHMIDHPCLECRENDGRRKVISKYTDNLKKYL